MSAIPSGLPSTDERPATGVSACTILFVTSYYWPETGGQAQYVTGLAEHLARQGNRVVVATGFPHYPEWRYSDHRQLAAHETRAGVIVRRRTHYVPRTQSAAKRALYEASLFASGLTAVFERVRPDLVLGVVPSLAAGALTAAVARVVRRPYGLVFQDLMGPGSEQSGFSGGGGGVSQVVRAIELGIARRAAAVGVIADGFREYLESGGVDPARIVRVRNWSLEVAPTQTVAETRSRLGWGATEFVCLHAGNMGFKQGLDHVLDAARLLDGEASLVLAGDGSDRARLVARGRELGLANLSFLGVQQAGQYEAMLRAADVLLVNQRPSVSRMSLPSKLTSYLAAGRPVIASVAAGSETAEEVERSGAGVITDPTDPSALADAIAGLKRDPGRARALGSAGQEYARRYLSQDAALAGYDAFLAQTISGGGAR